MDTVIELRGACDAVYPVDEGVLDARAIRAFSGGQCHGLALALHERTGWKLVAVHNAEGVCEHICVRNAEGHLVDVLGIRTDEAISTPENGKRIRPIDPAGIADLVSQRGWAPPAVAAAESWVDEVLARSRRTAINETESGETFRRLFVDENLELEFEWDGTMYLDVRVRWRAGPQGHWKLHRQIKVPRDSDGLRRIDFTSARFERIISSWIKQRYDRSAAELDAGV